MRLDNLPLLSFDNKYTIVTRQSSCKFEVRNRTAFSNNRTKPMLLECMSSEALIHPVYRQSVSFV